MSTARTPPRTYRRCRLTVGRRTAENLTVNEHIHCDLIQCALASTDQQVRSIKSDRCRKAGETKEGPNYVRPRRDARLLAQFHFTITQKN
jgi:hypothetical protein